MAELNLKQIRLYFLSRLEMVILLLLLMMIYHRL